MDYFYLTDEKKFSVFLWDRGMSIYDVFVGEYAIQVKWSI